MTQAPPTPSYSATPTRAQTGFWQRGPVGMFVIAVHVVLIYFVAASLGIVEMPNLAKPMEAVIIDSPARRRASR